MATKLVTPPTADQEPVSLAEAKAHLREEGSESDLQIGVLIAAARSHIEEVTGVYFAEQTLELIFDAFPYSELQLRGPVISVESVKYDDVDGYEQTVDPANYWLDATNSPGWIVPVADAWPATITAVNSVRVRIVVGYEDPTHIPASIKAAILLLVGHWYANREAVVIGKSTADLPMGVAALIAPFRRWFV